jgi:hypothetical protein
MSQEFPLVLNSYREMKMGKKTHLDSAGNQDYSCNLIILSKKQVFATIFF